LRALYQREKSDANTPIEDVRVTQRSATVIHSISAADKKATQPDAVALHIHGGWFNWASAKAFRNVVGRLATHAGAIALSPDFRLGAECARHFRFTRTGTESDRH
jgi:acetyl esterase/lipase